MTFLPPYDAPFTPVPQVTPLTYRDGLTLLKKLDNIVRYINRTLVPFVNDNYEELADAFETQVNALIIAVNAAIDSVINESIEVQDSVVEAIISDTESLTRNFLDDTYASKTVVDTINALVTSGRLSQAQLDGRYPLKNRITNFDVRDYGAIGDGVANDTVAVQAAVTAAAAATDPLELQNPLLNNQHPVVYFPKGTYSINQVDVPGSMKLTGPGTAIYGAAVLRQRSAGSNIIRLTADTDGQSNAVVFENLTFKSASGTVDSTVAQIKTVGGIVSHSVYVRNCWFATPENTAIWFTQGDDIVITGCTFDVAAFDSIWLGQAGGLVRNISITNNTFFDVAVNAIRVFNASGITINNNRAYTHDAAPKAGSVFLVTSEAAEATNISVTGNEVNLYHKFVSIGAVTQVVAITGNSVRNTQHSCLELTGTGIVYNIAVTGNAFGSTFAYTSGAAIVATSDSGLNASVITGNSVIPGTTIPLFYDLSAATVTANKLKDNAFIRCVAEHNLANPTANGY